MKTSRRHAFENRLAAYSAAAGAVLIGSGQAGAGFVHTNLDPNVVLCTSGDLFHVDFASTGTNQFRIEVQFVATALYGVRNNLLDVLASTPGAFWRGGSGFHFDGASAIDYGMPVSTPAARWGRRTTGTANMGFYSTSVGVTDGYFIDTTNKYLGLKFRIGGQIHYGWLHVMVNANCTTTTITGYAYNTIPDQNIQAGKLQVPEAGSLSLLALGAAGLSAWRGSREKLCRTPV